MEGEKLAILIDSTREICKSNFIFINFEYESSRCTFYASRERLITKRTLSIKIHTVASSHTHMGSGRKNKNEILNFLLKLMHTYSSYMLKTAKSFLPFAANCFNLNAIKLAVMLLIFISLHCVINSSFYSLYTAEKWTFYHCRFDFILFCHHKNFIF